ncbi:Uncharacterised protein [Mycobacteroides abscessus subsp. bolletii]|uniref:Uncharacterized protein n=1 Tax=Mycobacteroides abscessus subsp. bolletii TaxID=319705 RepID=A0A9Q7SAU5_9MYCO|nr:hypothetical protein [Mycobacteroides abscessus]SHQ26782.1 Uncharacterised protein [Mycobacteroides abscessus subsp. bolletii]SHR93048.1 Uncharacterised protein [Mycobacteroides abscessus subsp. bolletii]SHS50586.1 Uncharacterised protein [Mycobacteroides abscessus subsp. bolletii]SHT82175.1 Uncharacterised protein [Mycobacteroides abscessus subsp. bolletii]SHU13787.1 Uncharacterised protein [Mycobacteroides abscessus subsp. bolletii]
MQWWEWIDRPDLALSAASLVVAIASLLITITIPFLILRLTRKQEKERDQRQIEQARSLTRQERLAEQNRRDYLLDRLGSAHDPNYLAILFHEISEITSDDGRALLKRQYRANPTVPLPPGSLSRVDDRITESADVDDYVEALERRYSEKGSQYPKLIEFVKHARLRTKSLTSKQLSAIADLVVSDTLALIQRPNHQFFRKLVNTAPDIASNLLGQIEDVPSDAPNGLKLNILTGTLLAAVDVIEERQRVPDLSAFRLDYKEALASLIHRESIRSLDHWEIKGSTEPVSATVAWLVRVAGWAVDGDDHVSMRMVDKLAEVILSIPERDRGWGVDDRQIQLGFADIQRKCPGLWRLNGSHLEAAASANGEWRGDQAQTQ